MPASFDQAKAQAKLRATGIAITELALSSTIRPTQRAPADARQGASEGALDASLDDTLAARPTGSAASRPLPRITVDLRGSRPSARNAGAAPEADLEVRGLIGEGGMGRVLLTRQHSLERDVAVKTAKDGAPQATHDALLFEGRITGQLEHPAIVPVHALGLDSTGRPALVMKRIEGVSWDELLADPEHEGWQGWDGSPDDRLPGHLQILMQVCNAVHFAHSRGIVHRDLKPENVLIGRYGDVYVADWGIAARVGEDAAGRLCGTLGYMASEMALGGIIDERTDVYLLGSVLHEVLTGDLRHHAPTSVAALLAAHSSAPFLYGPEIPAELGALANGACAKEPSARPQSAQAFRQALLDFREHQDSVGLTHEALERLSSLDALLAFDEPSDAERRAIDERFAEARFALDQALRSWPGNSAAQAARDRLDHLLAERRARAEALETLARERDPTVGTQHRAFALGLLALLGVAMLAATFFKKGPVTPVESVGYGALLLVVLGGVVTALRRQVMANQFNRQLNGMLFIAAGLVMVPRVIGLFIALEIPWVFAANCFSVAGVCFMGGLTLLRWIAWIGLIMVVGAIAIICLPHLALQLLGITTASAAVLAAILARITPAG